MPTWTGDDLDEIGAAEELDLASVRRDGTLRRPVTMWVVRDGDDLYVRSVNGRGSSWFRGAQSCHQARVRAGEVEKDVELVETDTDGNAVDAAYEGKYAAATRRSCPRTWRHRRAPRRSSLSLVQAPERRPDGEAHSRKHARGLGDGTGHRQVPSRKGDPGMRATLMYGARARSARRPPIPHTEFPAVPGH